MNKHLVEWSAACNTLHWPKFMSSMMKTDDLCNLKTLSDIMPLIHAYSFPLDDIRKKKWLNLPMKVLRACTNMTNLSHQEKQFRLFDSMGLIDFLCSATRRTDNSRLKENSFIFRIPDSVIHELNDASKFNEINFPYLTKRLRHRGYLKIWLFLTLLADPVLEVKNENSKIARMIMSTDTRAKGICKEMSKLFNDRFNFKIDFLNKKRAGYFAGEWTRSFPRVISLISNDSTAS